MVQILTDSTADLGKALAGRYQIQTIPLYVIMDNKTYADGVEITTTDLFRSVEKTGQLPKTSAPSVQDFAKFFQQSDNTIYIGLSSRLSATLQNALLAQESFEPDRVFVIDSLNLSTGIGLLAIKAARLRDEGCRAEEIAEQINLLVPKVRASFIIETLDYLYKGGRCSAMQNLMGSLLHIRPVIAVRSDGSLGVKGRTRGTRQKALRSMLDDFMENLDQIDLEQVFITHTSCGGDAEYLKNELMQMAPINEVLITDAGSVIASHCGPETIGILYLLK